MVDRSELIASLKQMPQWDFIVIGGGATGLGTALDAASRGFSVLLLEAHDFAKATSSRSTKLIHGGLRYLRQGHFLLVKEALNERTILRNNAPELVWEKAFIIPFYSQMEKYFYLSGLKIYDFLAGKSGFPSSSLLTKEALIEAVPTIETSGLKGGIRYYDGQFDDARLAISLAKTCLAKGGICLNYFPVTQLLMKSDRVIGVKAKDRETDLEYELFGTVVINATGVFCDAIRKMESPLASNIIKASQGVHIVVGKKFMPTETALMIPNTKDGRVIFIIPWLGSTLIGTTDIEQQELLIEPHASQCEIDFLIEHANCYLKTKIRHSDIKAIFAGLRPLVNLENQSNTAKIPREYAILISSGGMISVTGGKWTTYRKMAEKVIDKAIIYKNLPKHPCNTRTLKIINGPALVPGSYFIEGLPIQDTQVINAIKYEMACTLEDVLARRTRCLFLDAAKTLQIAQPVAELMAVHLQKNGQWVENQCNQLKTLIDSQFSLGSSNHSEER